MPGAVIMGLPERFWAKTRIADCGYETPCVVWTAYKLPNGYGRVAWKGAPRLAHRVAYEAQVAAIPDGLMIDHLCRNRACVNVSHLEPVTNQVNILRGETIMAAHAAKTHCKNGHSFDEANTRLTKAGHRICIACEQGWRAARSVQQKAERAANPPKPRTHCKHGHPLSGSNVRLNRAGARVCLACTKLAEDRYKARKQAALDEHCADEQRCGECGHLPGCDCPHHCAPSRR